MTAFADAITTAPLAHDQDRAARVTGALPGALQGGATGALLAGAAGSSPYLARLIERHAEWLEPALARPADAVLTEVLADLDPLTAPGTPMPGVRSALRLAKARAALWIGLADLGGVWDLAEVTGALTRLADRAVQVAAARLLADEIAAGRLPEGGDAGFIVLAMGKMGAFELNYSSDIDLIALFDDSRFGGDDVLEMRARYVHVTKQMVRLLSDNIAGGYVFRTDLRLRPSPSTTPVCMAVSAAERYYESVGRTWERAAHIKARAVVGTEAGGAYLETLAPFIWRRYLDFAAIEDTHDLLLKIRAQQVRFSPGALPGHDLKLSPGGIREIEFFAQTRQLIFGGRDIALRERGTEAALSALAGAGIIGAEVRDQLSGDYRALRSVEHRLQMMEDAQTHTVPLAPEARARLAALAGAPDQAVFERALSARLARVHGTAEAFFQPRAASAPGIDAATLTGMGFERPDDAARQIARWRDGEIAATRSERARALFAKLEHQIVEGLARAARPDQSLVQFDRFLSGLPAGVQVFSLFTANPQLLDLIVEICTAAPRLAAYLGRRPQTIDALLDRGFWSPLPDARALTAELSARLETEADYERRLDTARRWAREHGFRAGVQVLQAETGAEEAGAGFSGLADAAITGLLPHVIDAFAARHGPPPGAGLAVLAMGKLGSVEMTAASDLDLIVIYDPDGAETSEGPRPLGVGAYYPRLTQALVSALSAPTAEGRLYEVDMRLRPSGRKGPVAVSMAAFRRYQAEDAWVWEHMALTRARVIVGPEALRASIETVIGAAFDRRKGSPAVLDEARTMRARVLDATAADRRRSWSLKHAAGGLMEIEFLAQTGVLYHGLTGAARAPDALMRLAECGWLTGAEAETLSAAHRLAQRLQQIERVALEHPLDPAGIGPDLAGILAQAGGCETFEALGTRLADLQSRAAEICAARLDRG